MSSPPVRLDFSGTPSNATAKARDTALYDFLMQRLAAGTAGTGTATQAEMIALRASLGLTIKGTVAQASGIVTGAIIENGSNSNGLYTKFADGTQICTLSTSAQGAANVAIGAVYRSAAQTWVFPAAFISTPSCCVSELATNGYAWGGLGSGAASTSVTTFICLSASAQPAASLMSLLAIGRWY